MCLVVKVHKRLGEMKFTIFVEDQTLRQYIKNVFQRTMNKIIGQYVDKRQNITKCKLLDFSDKKNK